MQLIKNQRLYKPAVVRKEVANFLKLDTTLISDTIIAHLAENNISNDLKSVFGGTEVPAEVNIEINRINVDMGEDVHTQGISWSELPSGIYQAGSLYVAKGELPGQQLDGLEGLRSLSIYPFCSLDQVGINKYVDMSVNVSHGINRGYQLYSPYYSQIWSLPNGEFPVQQLYSGHVECLNHNSSVKSGYNLHQPLLIRYNGVKLYFDGGALNSIGDYGMVQCAVRHIVLGEIPVIFTIDGSLRKNFQRNGFLVLGVEGILELLIHLRLLTLEKAINIHKKISGKGQFLYTKDLRQFHQERALGKTWLKLFKFINKNYVSSNQHNHSGRHCFGG